jgi:hypothetical protein
MSKTQIIVMLLVGAFFIAALASIVSIWVRPWKENPYIPWLRSESAHSWAFFYVGCGMLMMVVDIDKISDRALFALMAILMFLNALSCQAKANRMLRDALVPNEDRQAGAPLPTCH